MVSNSSARYYKKKKGYKNSLAKGIKIFPNKKKKKKQEYGRERYEKLPKDKKYRKVLG